MKTRRRLAVLGLVGAVAAAIPLRHVVLNSLMYFPLPGVQGSPAAVGLPFEEMTIPTEDGERLHAWWVPAAGVASLGPLIYCHGNGGNISGRVAKVKLLAQQGFDVLAFDYRGYGGSTGKPSEPGTYRDARAALAALAGRPGVDPRHAIFLGESLGGAVALHLALESPPRGLVLQSAFTSVRDVGRLHYAWLPRFIVPDAYPSLSRIGRLACPLLVVHGDVDEVIPFAQGEALYGAAPEPKTFQRLPGIGHNDVASRAGEPFGAALSAFARSLPPG